MQDVKLAQQLFKEVAQIRMKAQNDEKDIQQSFDQIAKELSRKDQVINNLEFRVDSLEKQLKEMTCTEAQT